MNPVRWGLLSTASIGRVVVEATRRSEVTCFAAVASRDGDRARQFAEHLDLEMVFASYEALLDCASVDAVYIALPNSMHIEWTVKALRAGKHVLCEKPLALSPEDAHRAFDAAADGQRVCAEGFMYLYIRLAATMRLRQDVLAQFDVGFDLPRRDELELIGTEGKIIVADPWLCRPGTIELLQDGRTEQLPVDPEGAYALAHDDSDVYRIELDTVSRAIASGAELPYGRTDAVGQARALQALISSSEKAAPVVLS